MPAEKRILITGGAGYIGSVLVDKLLRREFGVVVLDNFTYTDMGIRHLLKHPDLSVIHGDIRDVQKVRAALAGIEFVIHLAAIANDPSGELHPELTRSINYRVYPVLLEEAKKAKVRRFINASTMSVYGIKSQRDISEDTPLEPLKEYSICKAKSEKIVADFDSPGFTTTNLRCATVCGWSPRMRFDLIVNTLVYHAHLHKKITVWGGDQQRPQVHIHDITDYFIALLSVPAASIAGEVFNAVGENVSITEIAETIKSVIGSDIEIETAPPRQDERSYHASSEKIARILGLKPKHSIRGAVLDIQKAYKKEAWRNPADSLYHNVKRIKELGMG